jgi:hypothetical protein
LGIPFFADNLRVLTESFDPKIADAENPFFGNFEITCADEGLIEVTHGLPRRTDAQ